MHRHAVEYSTYPRGPRLGPGCSVPVRRDSIGPIRPTRGAHRGFTARRLIRDAFAVRERLGDPRMIRSFHCTFLPSMPPSPTRGVQHRYVPETSMPTWPSPFDHRLGTPNIPAIRSTRGSHFVASLVRFRYGLLDCSPPCTDQTGSPSLRDFYFQAFNGSVTLSVAGYNYNSGWISFCWRDLHPLEWRLASLHGQTETSPAISACPLYPQQQQYRVHVFYGSPSLSRRVI